ncbi:superoxide dismutase [Ni], partial [Bacteroidota bacterium]
MKKYPIIILASIALLFISQRTSSHCEVPCGIYDDELRIDLIYEHITTIEKAMKQIGELEKAEPVNYNQVVRWINTKEEHANEIQHIASQYFMTQRIKAVDNTDQAAFDKYI